MANYTGKEVVQMAMRMEEVGQAFYEALAGSCDNPSVASLCRRLARVESGHRVRFKAIYDRVNRPGVDIPMPEDARAQAETLVRSQIVPEPAEVRKVALGGKLKDAIALAMKMEQDSIGFYSSMLPLVPSGKDDVTRIIDEERAHLRELQDYGT